MLSEMHLTKLDLGKDRLHFIYYIELSSFKTITGLSNVKFITAMYAVTIY